MSETPATPLPQTITPTRRRGLAAAGAAALAGVVLVAGLSAFNDPQASAESADAPAACTAQDPASPPPAREPVPTTVDTVAQAYYCIFDNYYGGSLIDDRQLLQYAFQAVVRDLRERGIDQPRAVLPALTGDRDEDWSRFAERLQEVLDAATDDEDVRSALAVTAIEGMLESLHDNHAGYLVAGGGTTSDAQPWGLGIGLNRTLPAAETAPDFTGPLFLTSVDPDTPAAAAGLKPGDVIDAVNGVPVFTNGQLNPGVLDYLRPPSGESTPVVLSITRPATGRTKRVRVVPGPLPAQPQTGVEAEVVDGGIASVRVGSFYPGVAQEVLQAVADLQESTAITGVVLDMRGNRGGLGDEANRLLGAFVHDASAVSFCDAEGACEPQPVDDSVPLLNLPMATLVDDGCASACEVFATGVKDLGLGALVGTRTAGANSGPALEYALDDGVSLIRLPSHRVVGANGEIIDGVGVPPDHYAPLTAEDLSAGEDAALDKAVELLGS
ncbi:S41 family peptidase [Glycomyces sp. MUSA5-2]|uniref:S41 family peptidase n=1 Tax=Glycomyces sp. MUSA5-2 TaxID=2053002 RepID=UPI00300A94AE